MPELIWIFGPNSVGKTTNAQFLTGGIEHFNLDKIIMNLVQVDYPGLIDRLKGNPEDSFLREQFLIGFSNNSARGKADLYNSCILKIRANESFSLESNFLPAANEILTKAIEKGYSLSVIYIGEKDVDGLKDRVYLRTQLTGQYVAESEIARRFEAGINDLNNLLEKPNIGPYKEALNEIVIFTSPKKESGISPIIYIRKGKVIELNETLVKEWSKLVPNIKEWIVEYNKS